jgi:Chlorophyllase enzyme
MRAAFLSFMFACMLLACDSEQDLKQPTQVLVTVHSNYGEDLTRVEVRLFDVREQNPSDGYDFDLSSDLTLPLSFAVVPADDRPAQRLLVVVSGRNVLGELLAQTKAIAAFAPGEIKALDVWLLQACRSVMCAAGQTCGAMGSVAGQCSETPTLEGRAIKPGDEKRETTPAPVLEVSGDAGEGGMPAPLGSDAGPDAAPGDGGGSQSSDAALDAGGTQISDRDASMGLDAARDAAADATSVVPKADSGGADARAADANMPLDTGMMLPADPVLPLVLCHNGSTEACGSFEAESSVITLGPMGAIMEPNVGAAFANTIDPADNLAACSAVLQSDGYAPIDADFLANTDGLDLRLYTLYRPANWRRDARYPVVVWGNGTCYYPELYGGVLRALASQGFIVIAPNTRVVSGAQLLNALRFLLPLNDNSANPYYLRMDTSKIAVIGAPASATSAGADPRVSTAVLMNGAGNLQKPFLMIAADSIDGFAVNQLMNATNQASASAYLFLHGNDSHGARVGVRHPDRLATPITSWLKYRLENDAASRSMFVGASCGFCNRASEFDYGQKGLN